MLVRVSAFDVEIDSGTIALEPLVENLAALNGIQEEEGREYYFDNQAFGGFCVGVIITIKDQKSFCTLETNADGESVIQVNGLEEGNSIMDFNFFAINLANGIGVYQHYHQSAAISSLDKRFRTGVNDLKERYVEHEIAEETVRRGHELSEHAKYKIRKKHKSKAKVRTLVSRETLKQLLEQYTKIRGMEYSYSTLLPVIRDATPLGHRVEKKKESIFFSNPGIVATLSREIVAAVNNYDIGKGRVFVEDADGIRDVIKIFDMPEELWERDYDDVVAMIDRINISDFSNNAFLQAMVELFDAADYRHILRAVV
ncbi:hypothetical protein GIW54_29620 [Pseudomonas proteolytica]|uniref:Uncharacterized protein n=1 Tax=Pseudomonas proteolytica TaxID=219574 RepID=A0AAW5ABR5_9PSED|nr:hypothetical protein [Pseudomonas proteolytica]MCF5061193.1 hypothetical protein [Pseudomonas proteolytica]MCF5104869.1 hypothetical protein [Pseudomonas proteolytica]